MIRALSLLSLFTLASFAQLPIGVIPAPQFPPQLKQYMELTDAQVATIVQLNESFERFRLEKSRRTDQVRTEIAEETAKPTLDAMALGLRYLELESIRRELQSEQSKLEGAIQYVLTAAQKTKLQSLRQAMQLQPVICAAQAVNLLTGTPGLVTSVNTGNIIPDSPWFNVSSFLLGTPACGARATFGGLLPGLPSIP